MSGVFQSFYRVIFIVTIGESFEILLKVAIVDDFLRPSGVFTHEKDSFSDWLLICLYTC